MTQSVNQFDFIDAFKKMGRSNQFTRLGLFALFDYLEQYEDDTGLQLELDVIALCCEYTEYENIAEYNAQYGHAFTTQNEIADYTAIIPIEGTEAFIIQNY